MQCNAALSDAITPPSQTCSDTVYAPALRAEGYSEGLHYFCSSSSDIRNALLNHILCAECWRLEEVVDRLRQKLIVIVGCQVTAKTKVSDDLPVH